MGRRYVKRKSDGLVFQSQEEEFFPLERAKEVALKQGGDLADYEIGVDTEANIDAWIKTHAESVMSYADKRKAEYPSLESVTVAMAEKLEGNSAMWDEITKQRKAIKDKHPKG